MSRAIAAALLILTSLVVASAQDGDRPGVRLPIGGGRSYLPFEVTQVDGKTAWQATGRGTLKIEDLVGGISSALNVRMTYSPGTIQTVRPGSSTTVPYVTPESGITIKNEDLFDFANGMLEHAGLAIITVGQGECVLASTAEAPRYARMVQASELATLPRTEWVMTTRQLVHSDARSLQQALERTVGHWSRNVGVHGPQLLIAGPVSLVDKVFSILDAIDVPGADSRGEIVRSYTVPATVQAAQAASMLRELFDESTTTVNYPDNQVRVVTRKDTRAHFTALGNRVVVRADASTHSLVEAAIAAMQ